MSQDTRPAGDLTLEEMRTTPLSKMDPDAARAAVERIVGKRSKVVPVYEVARFGSSI